MGSVRHFRVWRGDTDGGGLQDFQVEVNDGEVVLDIVHRLQMRPFQIHRYDIGEAPFGDDAKPVAVHERGGAMAGRHPKRLNR